MNEKKIKEIAPPANCNLKTNYGEFPSVYKAFSLGDQFIAEIVSLEGNQALRLRSNDLLVANFSTNGLYIDDFMGTQPFITEISRSLKVQDPKALLKDRVFDMKLASFKVLLQLYGSKDLMEDKATLEVSLNYFGQVLDRICFMGRFLTLYYPLSEGFEEKLLLWFFNKLVWMRKYLNPQETNYLEFPSKIVFLCGGKQKEKVLKIFKRCEEFVSCKGLPPDLKYGGSWSFRTGVSGQNPKNSKETADLLKPRGMIETGFSPQNSEIIERAYIFEVKSVPILLNENRLEDILGGNEPEDFEPNGSNEKILIDLEKMTKRSLLTGLERPITFDSQMEEYQFFDPASEEFVPIDSHLNEVFNYRRKLRINTLVFHIDRELKLIQENAFYVDMKEMVMRPDTRSLVSRVPSKHEKKRDRCYPLSRKPEPTIGKSHLRNIGLRESWRILTIKESDTSQFEGSNIQRQDSFEYKSMGEGLETGIEIGELKELEGTYPKYWFLQFENLEKIDLHTETEEYEEIKGLFLETSGDLQVCSITRIQNRKLWDSFNLESKRLAVKGNSQQKTLFHGTQLINPKDVYSGTEYAFQTRQGPLGKAVYFSEDSRDSVQGYEYKVNDGRFAVILAKVLVGNCHEVDPRDLKKGLISSKDLDSSYDSVRTGGVYAVYESNRAYPAYAISYKPKSY